MYLFILLIAYGCRKMMCIYTSATLILCAQHVVPRKCFSTRNELYDLGNNGSIPTGAITGCRLPNARFSFVFRCSVHFSSRCEVLELSHQPTVTGRLLAARNHNLCTGFFAGTGNFFIDFRCKLGGTLSYLFCRLSCSCTLRHA